MLIKVRFPPNSRQYTYQWAGEKSLMVGDEVLVPDKRSPGAMKEAVVMELSSSYRGHLVTVDRLASERRSRTITLTASDFIQATEVGLLRNQHAYAMGCKPGHGIQSGDDQRVNIIGAAGEIACARALGIENWAPGIDTFKAADIGKNIQVRTRQISHRAYSDHLIVRRDDGDDDIFILVTMDPTVNMMAYTVQGYLTGAQAKQPEYLYGYGSRPKAYFIPPNRLSPLWKAG